MESNLSGLSINDQSNKYHTINVSGNARAILGNVASDSHSFQHGFDVDWKNTLKALYFEGMRTRKAQISQRAGSPEYVQWIWRTEFADWLGSDESFFWITGRAGSGKSTLMKHIADSRKTKQHLERNGQSWMVIHFFFDFRAGYGTANNLEGMLRSLLYQLLQRCPDLAQNIDGISHDRFLNLDVVSCLDYVCQVADMASSKICAFIDGLDEFEGSGAELVETVRSLEDRAGFKLCLASRPYEIFKSSFSRYANLTVQNFNDESIRMYIQAQWKNERLGVQASLPEAFGNKIRDKAGGVFLWARLAIDELLQDLLRGKSMAALELQLDEMPREVEDMYQRILDRVPSIMKLETAMLLYMIMSSNSTGVQIRKLYIALSSHAQKQSTKGEAQMLPIDLNDEEGLSARIVNVVGDFVDVSTCYESYGFDRGSELEYKDLIPVIVMRNNELLIRKGPVPGVTLTHETLRTFLNGNGWLRSHIPANLGTVAPERLWTNMYLDEMEIAASIGPSDIEEVSSVIRSFVQRAYTFLWDKKWVEIDCMGENLLAILRGWSAWTPLLLLAIQDLLREVAQCRLGILDAVDAQKVGLMLRTQVMQYHLAICLFQSCSPAALDSFYRDQRGLPEQPICANLCAYSLPNELYDCVTHIEWDNFFSICHGLPGIALHGRISGENRREEVEKVQILFNHIWRKFLVNGHDREPYPLLIDRLVSAGARLRGPDFCLFLRYKHFFAEDFFPKFFRSHPAIVLTHADDCDLKEGEDTYSGFLRHWAEFIDSNGKAPDILEATFDLLLRCGEQANANFGCGSLLNMLLGDVESVNFLGISDRMRKICIALKAGMDPDQISRDGNSIEAVRAVLLYLKNPPEEAWLRRMGSVFEIVTEGYIEGHEQEILKVEEMLEEYFEKGSLTQGQLDGYARFNNRISLWGVPIPSPEMNPYRLFGLKKD